MWYHSAFFYIIAGVAILFLLWLFFGGGEHEFVGFEPILHPDDEVCPVEAATEEATALEEGAKESEILESRATVEALEEEAESCPLIAWPEHEVPKVPPPKKPSRWKRQEECCRTIEEILGRPFERDIRPDFLKNPETGFNLELDCYNSTLRIGVEHNGEQHYHYPNAFHKSEEEWLSLVRRDQFKVDRCDKNGVYLITIPYTVPFGQIKNEIRRQLEPLLSAR